MERWEIVFAAMSAIIFAWWLILGITELKG